LNHFLSIKIPGKSPGLVMVMGFQFDQKRKRQISVGAETAGVPMELAFQGSRSV
jgi:hypothetical protein